MTPTAVVRPVIVHPDAPFRAARGPHAPRRLWPLQRGLALLVSVVLVLAHPAGLVRAAAPPLAPTGAPTEARADLTWDAAERVVQLTNAARAGVGLPPLAISGELAVAAEQYASVMARSGCFGHACGPVPDLSARCADAGYPMTTMVGENVAAGQQSAEEVVWTWLSSPGHQANMLHSDFTEVGVGVVSGGRYGAYWVQTFGTR